MRKSGSGTEIFLSPEDGKQLNITEGDPIILKSQVGEYRGVCRFAPLQPRTVMVFWPEANVLIPRRLDPLSNEPDYNTIVTVQRIVR